MLEGVVYFGQFAKLASDAVELSGRYGVVADQNVVAILVEAN